MRSPRTRPNTSRTRSSSSITCIAWTRGGSRSRRNLGFDDSAWAEAISLGAAAATGATWGVAPLRTLEPRDVAAMDETPARFARVIEQRRVRTHPFGETPSGWSLAAGEGGSLLLDPGAYVTGFPELDFVGGADREVRITYAEALGEWIGRNGRRTWTKGTVRDDFTRFEPHGYRDTLILRAGETAGSRSTGVRFASCASRFLRARRP